MGGAVSSICSTVSVIAVGFGAIFVVASPASAAVTPVGLGTAESFAVLAGTTVTNTGPSMITGDLGVSPGSAVTNFPPGIVLGGTIHTTDAVATQAQADVTTAYNDTAGRPPSAMVGTELGGRTLVGGVYRGGTLGITGTLTLDAQGDPDAVFIFQAASTLTTASASRVRLINGSSPCNVFWQIGSSATLGTASTFLGTVLALASVTANTGASISGRLLARTGAITLDASTVNRSTGCAATAASSTIAADAPVGGLFNLRARLTQSGNGAPIVGRTVVMSTTTGVACQAMTTADGVATCSGIGAAAQVVLDNGYSASFAGDSQFLASSARPTLLAGASGSSSRSPVPATAGESGQTTTSPTASSARSTRPSQGLAATGGSSRTQEWGLLLLLMGGGLALGLSARRRMD